MLPIKTPLSWWNPNPTFVANLHLHSTSSRYNLGHASKLLAQNDMTMISFTYTIRLLRNYRKIAWYTTSSIPAKDVCGPKYVTLERKPHWLPHHTFFWPFHHKKPSIHCHKTRSSTKGQKYRKKQANCLESTFSTEWTKNAIESI